MLHPKGLVAIILWVCIYASCARAAGHAEALEEMTQVIWETTAILKKIHSVDDARAAQSELMALSQRGLDIQKKMKALIGTKIPNEAKRYRGRIWGTLILRVHCERGTVMKLCFSLFDN